MLMSARQCGRAESRRGRRVRNCHGAA